METMQAAVFRRYGPLGNLQPEIVQRPAPSANQVLVQVYAVGLNDYEFGLINGSPLIIRFFLGLRRPKITIPGCDMAGRVVAVGSAVSRWQVGDAVFGDLSGERFGALAEFVCCKESLLASIPEQFDFLQAAAMPMAIQLAIQGLAEVRPLVSGQEVLINGAGGGVGYYGAQLAKPEGVRLTGVDTLAKAEHLRALGYDETIDYESEDFTRREKQFDLILDTKTSRSPFAYLRALKPGGVYATVGGSMRWFMLGLLLSLPLRWLTGKRYTVVALRPNADLERCCELVASGKLHSKAHHVFAFSEFAKALELLASGEQQGKIVLRMPVLDAEENQQSN